MIRSRSIRSGVALYHVRMSMILVLDTNRLSSFAVVGDVMLRRVAECNDESSQENTQIRDVNFCTVAGINQKLFQVLTHFSMVDQLLFIEVNQYILDHRVERLNKILFRSFGGGTKHAIFNILAFILELLVAFNQLSYFHTYFLQYFELQLFLTSIHNVILIELINYFSQYIRFSFSAFGLFFQFFVFEGQRLACILNSSHLLLDVDQLFRCISLFIFLSF